VKDHTAAVTRRLEYCQRDAEFWKSGAIEVPLEQAGMTFDEAGALFGRPALAGVRQAVEEHYGTEAGQ
jgi:hypothetical protein